MCKGVITIAALALSCGFAFGDSISNLSQIVGRDITQEVCLAMTSWPPRTLQNMGSGKARRIQVVNSA